MRAGKWDGGSNGQGTSAAWHGTNGAKLRNCSHMAAWAWLERELDPEAGDTRWGGFSSAQAAEGTAQAVVVAVAMRDTTELAVPQLPKWSDLLAAV